MKVIYKEKPDDNFLWEHFVRCENDDCQVLLEINEFDVIAECIGYDRDFGTSEYAFFFKCPECGKISELYGGDIDSLAREISIRKLKKKEGKSKCL